MEHSHFDALILIGRPASGKSEILQYLKGLQPEERKERYSLGELDVLDDFPMLWAWFEEDKILSKELGQPRLHTDEDNDFKHGYFWHLLIRRLGLEYQKRRREEDYHEGYSSVIEFSRGSAHGGYREALEHLPEELLARAAILYVKVSYEESLRKNRRRFNPERPDSVLEHGLPDEKMERLYGDDDFPAWAAESPEHLRVGEISIPYVIFENEDDVTSGKTEALAARLQDVLGELWQRYQDVQQAR